MKTIYEIRNGSSNLADKYSNFSFDSYDYAVSVATEFKVNPRSHNSDMSDDNVAYWKRQNYTVVKIVTIIEEMITI